MEIRKLNFESSEIIGVKINPSEILKNVYFHSEYEKTSVKEEITSKFFGLLKSKKENLVKENYSNVIVDNNILRNKDTPNIKKLSNEELESLVNNKSIEYFNFIYGKKTIILGNRIYDKVWEINTLPSITIKYNISENYPRISTDINSPVTYEVGIRNVEQELYFSNTREIREFIINVIMKNKSFNTKAIYVDENNKIIKNLKEYIENYDK